MDAKDRFVAEALTVVEPQCLACKHWDPESPMVCAAFPDGIPQEIIDGQADHDEPVDGDHGIQFEPSEDSRANPYHGADGKFASAEGQPGEIDKDVKATTHALAALKGDLVNAEGALADLHADHAKKVTAVSDAEALLSTVQARLVKLREAKAASAARIALLKSGLRSEDATDDDRANPYHGPDGKFAASDSDAATIAKVAAHPVFGKLLGGLSPAAQLKLAQQLAPHPDVMSMSTPEAPAGGTVHVSTETLARPPIPKMSADERITGGAPRDVVIDTAKAHAAHGLELLKHAAHYLAKADKLGKAVQFGEREGEGEEGSDAFSHAEHLGQIIDEVKTGIEAKHSKAVRAEAPHAAHVGHSPELYCEGCGEGPARDASTRARPLSPGRKHVDAWATETSATLEGRLRAALKKTREQLVAAFTGPEPKKALKKLLKVADGSNVKEAYRQAVKRGFASTKKVEAAELVKLAESRGLVVRASTDGLTPDDEIGAILKAEVGDIDDYIDQFGMEKFDEVYDNVVTKNRDIFTEALNDGWNPDKLTDELMKSTDDISVANIKTIVRTSGTDFFGQARLAAGNESNIVKFYRRSEIDDDRITEMCKTLNGIELAPDRKELAVMCSALHWNCRGDPEYGLDDNFETDEARLKLGLSMLDPKFKRGLV